MMLFMNVLPVVALFSLGLSAFSAETPGEYTFTIDGEPYSPWLRTTEGPEPVPGDVADFESFRMCLDAPGHYDLKTKDGITRRVLEGGRSVIVACSISEKDDDPSPVKTRLKRKPSVSNPLAAMSDAEVKGLRGVSLWSWPEGIEKDLARLNWEHLCLSIYGPALSVHGRNSPPLPEKVRTLVIYSGGSWACEEMGGLARLKHLRFLDLKGTLPDKFDFAALKGMPLVYLAPPLYGRTQNTGTLATLTQLKALDAGYSDLWGDGRWLSQLSDLRQLDASGAGSTGEGVSTPLDLACLADLPRLVSLKLSGTQIKSLPSTPMPSLKTVDLLLSTATPGMIDAFAKANPQARMVRSMNAELSAQLAKADSVKARTGGVCHRRPEQEKTIAETRDRREIAELIRHFEVVDSESRGHCMCCGNPTFEFYQGNETVATIAFHHGHSIRWPGGIWPGDGMLTSLSAEYLIEWLDKNGCPGPKNDMLERRRQQAAAGRRDAHYAALLPPGLGHALSDAESLNEATVVFEKAVPDVRARAKLCLQLFGCDDGTWSLSTGYDGPLADTWLPGIPAETLHAVINDAPEKTEEGQGAARWLFGSGHLEEWKAEPGQLKRLARFALTHPRQKNRWRTLVMLRELGSPEALGIIRDVLKNGTEPRKLGADYEAEAGGQMAYSSNDIPFSEGTPDTVAAAFCLAMVRDHPTSAEVARIRAGLNEETQKQWDEDVSLR